MGIALRTVARCARPAGKQPSVGDAGIANYRTHQFDHIQRWRSPSRDTAHRWPEPLNHRREDFGPELVALPLNTRTEPRLDSVGTQRTHRRHRFRDDALGQSFPTSVSDSQDRCLTSRVDTLEQDGGTVRGTDNKD